MLLTITCNCCFRSVIFETALYHTHVNVGFNRLLVDFGHHDPASYVVNNSADLFNPRFVSASAAAIFMVLQLHAGMPVRGTVGQQQNFLSCTQKWPEDDYDQQGNLLNPIKVKEGKKEETG